MVLAQLVHSELSSDFLLLLEQAFTDMLFLGGRDHHFSSSGLTPLCARVLELKRPVGKMMEQLLAIADSL